MNHMISKKPKKPMTEAEALRRLAALCAKAEHSTGEMDQKMRLWQLDEAARQRVINKLIDTHFIDNTRFARAFANDKLHYDHWGRRKIEQALWQKGVDKNEAGPVLDAIADEEYLSVLRPLLKSKWPTIKADTDYERSAKLIKYALGRGFSFDLIKQCLNETGADIVDVDYD